MIRWSQTALSSLGGLVLARERGALVLWDRKRVVHCSARDGQVQAQWRAPVPLCGAACSEDGGSIAALAQDGQFWWFAPDLRPRWQRQLLAPGSGLALEPFGQYVALGTQDGVIHLLDRLGRTRWRTTVPRPLRRLAFVPEKPILLGCADFGLVVCFDAQGNRLWQHGLVAHVGSLSVAGNGRRVALACYSEGLCWFAYDQSTPRHQEPGLPCRLADLSYTGDDLLVLDLQDQLSLYQLPRQTNPRLPSGRSIPLPREVPDPTAKSEGAGEGARLRSSDVVSLVLSARGDRAFVGFKGGQVFGLDLHGGE